jgi:hypothetical protein
LTDIPLTGRVAGLAERSAPGDPRPTLAAEIRGSAMLFLLLVAVALGTCLIGFLLG